MRRNKGHTVEWKDDVFIDREKHWKGRKIKEALYINAQNPKKTEDKTSIMNLERGLDTVRCIIAAPGRLSLN